MTTPRFLTYTLAFLFLLGGLAACDSVEADGDDHAHEHTEAHGLRLVLGGTPIYQILQGTVTCPAAGCGVEVAAGAASGVITVELLAEDGDEIHTDDLDAAFRLGHALQNPALATVQQEDGAWRFQVHGEQVGTTTLRLDLLHNDHADFSTPPLTSSDAIPVRVVAP